MNSKQRLLLLKKISQTKTPETNPGVPESEAEVFADKVFDQVWDQAIDDLLSKTLD
jgi:hypothetical protein